MAKVKSKSQAVVNNCESCKFSVWDCPTITAGTGFCRRYPPSERELRYSPIGKTDWCGEWRGKR